MRNALLAVAGILLGSTFLNANVAEAAQFRVSDDGNLFALDGMIARGDTATMRIVFNNACQRNGHCPSLMVLNSPGGDLDEGYDLAGTIAGQGGIVTLVAPNQTCASACFIVYAVGLR